LKQLFVMDPLERINVVGDSTYVLMREAHERGWPVWFCEPRDLYAVQGAAWARARAVAVTADAPFFAPGPHEEMALADMDVVWMRKDPPFDMDYVFTTYLLDLVPKTTLVLNRPSSIRNANEKMFALEWPELCPPTLVTREITRARAFAAKAPGKIVIKPWDGNGGRGVLVTEHGDPNLGSMLEVLTVGERAYILVQHYLPEIAAGDKRIILVEGEALGWMLRVPQPGDHRGNMHVGAQVKGCDLTEGDRAICAAIGPRLREMGLLFVGIDVIGSSMTEINVTSPTGIQEINRLMGLRLERTVTDAVVARWRALAGFHAATDGDGREGRRA
jgi:glutathione synthase